MTARDSVREDVPGYLFVMSTLALAAVLYLGYASFVILKTVCVLCLTTYAAVIGIFLVSGAATQFPMTTLPRRAARDLRVLVGNPLAIGIVVLFFAGAATTLAFFPREGSVVSAATTPTAEVTQDQRSELEQSRKPLLRQRELPGDRRRRRRPVRLGGRPRDASVRHQG